jgi:protein-S-isoprenylcysteine O-methyltransferase Ste14
MTTRLGRAGTSPEPVTRPETIWSRGGAWVCAQFPLSAAAMLVSMVGPRLPSVVRQPGRWIGSALLGGGGVLFLAGLRGLGRQLTPFPKPRAGATLVQSGAYGIVRHPVYGGAILTVLGWALLRGRWAGLVASAGIAVFFDQKATREERWLVGQFEAYSAYRRRTHMLIPWLY